MITETELTGPIKHHGHRTFTAPGPWFLVIPALAVSLLALAPIAYLAVRAFEGGAGGIGAVLGLSHTRELLVNSVVLTVSVTVSATALGVILAWVNTRVRLPFAWLWRTAAALPLAIPTYIAALAWISRYPQIDGLFGAWLVLTLYSYPYVYLPVTAALRRIDPSLEEASRSLGVGSVPTFFRVVMPQIRPAVAAGALLVALYALSDFGAVSIMRFDALTLGIYTSYQAAFDRTPAVILSCLLVLITVLVVAGEAATRGQDRQSKVGAGAVRNNVAVDLGRWRWALVPFTAAMTLLTLGLPAVVLGGWFSEGLSAGGAFDDAWDYAANTFFASAAGAVATLLAAIPIGLLSARHASAATNAVNRISYIGHALPGIVISLSLVFFATRYASSVYQTVFLVVLAYVVLFLPLAVGAVHASAAQSPVSMEEAARSLGRRPFSTLVTVTLPLAAPGVAAGAALVFLTCAKELPATLLLRPTGFDTLATRVWSETNAGAFAAASVPAVLLVLLAAIPTYALSIRPRTNQ